MKHIVRNEFSDPFQSAQDLYRYGILQEQSSLAVMSFFTSVRVSQAREALLELLFEELINQQSYDKFKYYCRVKLHEAFGLLMSMGEYNNIKLHEK